MSESVDYLVQIWTTGVMTSTGTSPIRGLSSLADGVLTCSVLLNKVQTSVPYMV